MDGLVECPNPNRPASPQTQRLILPLRKKPGSAAGKDGKRTTFERAENFSQWLITEHLISTVPWDDAGPYVRFSVTFAAKDVNDEQRVLTEIAKHSLVPPSNSNSLTKA